MPETARPDPNAQAQFHRLYCRLAELGQALPAQAHEEIDALFAKLSCEAEPSYDLEDRIWALWCSHEEQDACTRMEQTIQAIARRDYAQAHELLDEMTRRWADWAEVWNKRATLLFLEGRDGESLADIDRTLALEPRHFGALCGLGQIAIRQGEPHLALAAFRAALRIHPDLPGARQTAESLHRALHRQSH